VVDILSRMLQKADSANLIRGLGCELVEGGVISLQYAADTILFIDKNEEGVRNLKSILTCFEMMSVMRINFHKSEVVPINISDQDESKFFADIFGAL
jgi:hypothetical protein